MPNQRGTAVRLINYSEHRNGNEFNAHQTYSKSPVISQGESWVHADPAQCSRIHLNDLAEQIPLYAPATSEDGGSLWQLCWVIRPGKG